MISKIQQIESKRLTKCLQIIVPEIVYQENDYLVIQPQIAAQIDIKQFKFNKNIKTVKKQQKQYNINNIIQQFKRSYIVVYEMADYNLEYAIINKTNLQLIRQYLYNILEGIQQLHQHRICHNDIKSSNCLIFDQQAKLSDFDLCKDLNIQNQQNQNILITNPMYKLSELIDSNNTTLQYSSPETNNILKIKSGYLGDIWQYGQLVIYCFTGLQLNIQITRNGDDYNFFKQEFGVEFADFISLCTETQSLRPNTNILLRHPFFTCTNLDDFKFDFKESLSKRLFNGLARNYLRSSSQPPQNLLSSKNIIKFQQNYKFLLNEIRVSLRNEIQSDYGTNNDKITDLIMSKDNQFKINRSQSVQNKKFNDTQISLQNIFLYSICNNEQQQLSPQYIDYFVIDKLDVNCINNDINSKYIQNLLILNNIFILGNVSGLHSMYFQDYDHKNNYQGEYFQYKNKILRFKSERQYNKYNSQPLVLQNQKIDSLSNQSLSSNRLKNNLTQDNISLASIKLQKQFSKSYIQLIEDVRKNIIVSQLTISNISDNSAMSLSKSFDNLDFETSSVQNFQKIDKLQKFQYPSHLEDSTEDISDLNNNINGLPPMPFIQQSNDSFDFFTFNVQNDQIQEQNNQIDNSQISNKTNASLNLSQSINITDNQKVMISVSKTSSNQQDDNSLQINNIFQVQQDNTIDENSSINSQDKIIMQLKNNDKNKHIQEFQMESSDFKENSVSSCFSLI